MRYVFALLLTAAILPACDDPDADAKLAEQARQIAMLQEQVAALQAQLGQRPDTTGMVMSLESRLSSLESRVDGVTAVKVPHLIGNPGTAEEMDLGPFVDFDHYWSDSIGAYVYFGIPQYEWANADCTGTRYIQSSVGLRYPYFNGPEGTIIKLGDYDPSFNYNSVMIDGQCFAMSQVGGRPFTDTGTPNTDKPDSMTVRVVN